jgi:hypothetical protein
MTLQKLLDPFQISLKSDWSYGRFTRKPTVVCKLIGISTYFVKIEVLLVADDQNRVVYLGSLWKRGLDY